MMNGYLGGNGLVIMAFFMGVIGAVLAIALLESRLKRFGSVVHVGGTTGGVLLTFVAFFLGTIYLQPVVPISILVICVFFLFRAGILVLKQN